MREILSPCPGENFSLKLTTQDLPDGYSEKLNFHQNLYCWFDCFQFFQGREWYATWVALADMYPVVVQLEILPFVDIGGTLNINIHLDELLIVSKSFSIYII